jgi:uncharacterized protein (TIGR00251 family)
MTKEWCSVVPQGIRLALQITPNAKRSEAVGVFDGMLKIRLQAQPIEGKANEALVRYLAGVLGVPKSAVAITHGHASKRKIIEIAARHLTVDDVQRALIGSEVK